MKEQSTRSTVTFRHPFVLSGDPKPLPAGTYDILVEEELLEGLSFQAFRRTGTYIMIEGAGGRSGTIQMRETTKDALDQAIKNDENGGLNQTA